MCGDGDKKEAVVGPMYDEGTAHKILDEEAVLVEGDDTTRRRNIAVILLLLGTVHLWPGAQPQDGNDGNYLVLSNRTEKATRTSHEKDPTLFAAAANTTIKDFWRTYRLGDWVLNTGKVAAPTKESWFRDSIAWEYLVELDEISNGTLVGDRPVKHPLKYDEDVFCNVVKRRGKSLTQVTRAGDVVLHLRLGDTLDTAMQSEEVKDAFEYGVSIVPSQIRRMINKHNSLGWWNYVKSKCFYENAIQKIEQIEKERDQKIGSNGTTVAHTQQKRRLIIVGSAVHQNVPSNNRNSLKYAELVQQFFAEKGYNVTLRLDYGTPDDDMVWMSTHSPIFVGAGGGFSKLVADCVENFGGVSLRPFVQKGVLSPIEEPCWTAPKPSKNLQNYSWESAGWHGKSVWSGRKNYPPDETVW